MTSIEKFENPDTQPMDKRMTAFWANGMIKLGRGSCLSKRSRRPAPILVSQVSSECRTNGTRFISSSYCLVTEECLWIFRKHRLCQSNVLLATEQDTSKGKERWREKTLPEGQEWTVVGRSASCHPGAWLVLWEALTAAALPTTVTNGSSGTGNALTWKDTLN